MRPHSVDPKFETIRLVLVYKNFAAHKGVSHIGLGVTALNIMKVLQRENIWVEVWPVTSSNDIMTRLLATQEKATQTGQNPVSHLVISAPWVDSADIGTLCLTFPDVHFAAMSHSNVGFLQADSNGMKLLREYIEIDLGFHNFRLAGNTERFTGWVNRAYNAQCVTLPNLYDLSGIECRPVRSNWMGSLLRIGCFGAVRPLKNTITAAAAALEMSKTLRADLEFYISGGRPEGGQSCVGAVREMLKNIRGVTLIEENWKSWPQFRSLVRRMDLLMQPSFTESFNMVTADGIAEGVPSVVSDAITWAPQEWIASSDDAGDIARVGTMLVYDPYAAYSGRQALQTHVDRGICLWKKFLLTS